MLVFSGRYNAFMPTFFSLVFFLSCFPIDFNAPMSAQDDDPTITKLQAESFARLALDGIVREFPNKPSNVLASPRDAQTPREMHPAFYGSFDWHSSVHGHWMLIRLLKLNILEEATSDEAYALLNIHLTRENIKKEADYFLEKQNKSFERMYGWAWFLRLCGEIENWDSPQGRIWKNNLDPLEEVILMRVNDYLPKLAWPIRAGVHRDTAFALTHVWDYAEETGNQSLLDLISESAKRWYLGDTNWNWSFEPSGQDFLSPGLEEVDLMRRILGAEDFLVWIQGFGLPKFEPVAVPEFSDGHLVHLAGLNLSRAWCLNGIATALPLASKDRLDLIAMAEEHQKVGLKYVTSGFYEGDHWLGSFAVYLTTSDKKK